ncbi:MAG TPA: winged helix DNA-binding domain-containing protein [Mycobacteriales bacterium]|nr:winged helix DNA-binding domain-containing protein [Mycobacteriales bacterium]
MSELVRRRLRSSRLSGAPLPTAAEAVGWFGAVQAQEFGAALWSVAQRTRGAPREPDLLRLFDDGALLRTHVLRPTWHFVRPEDIRWLLALTGPRVHALNGFMYRQNDLDDAVFARCHALLREALAGGRQLTRGEVADVLARGGIPAERFRLAYLLMHAELEGLICSGALRGRQHTYALLDERLPAVSPVPARSRDAALAELVCRYYASHGPATVRDLAWWSSLTLTDVRRGVELAGTDLVREEIDGRVYHAPAHPPPVGPDDAAPTAHLLQGYDEYAASFSESADVSRWPGVALPSRTNRPVYTHAVAVDGFVVGNWKRTIRATEVTIEVFLSASLDAGQRRAVEDAADRFGRFLGRPVTVAFAGPG